MQSWMEQSRRVLDFLNRSIWSSRSSPSTKVRYPLWTGLGLSPLPLSPALCLVLSRHPSPVALLSAPSLALSRTLSVLSSRCHPSAAAGTRCRFHSLPVHFTCTRTAHSPRIARPSVHLSTRRPLSSAPRSPRSSAPGVRLPFLRILIAGAPNPQLVAQNKLSLSTADLYRP
jgi:hypothetical protein